MLESIQIMEGDERRERNLNGLIFIKEIEFIIKNFPLTILQAQMISLGNVSKNFGKR